MRIISSYFQEKEAITHVSVFCLTSHGSYGATHLALQHPPMSSCPCAITQLAIIDGTDVSLSVIPVSLNVSTSYKTPAPKCEQNVLQNSHATCVTAVALGLAPL